MTFQRSTARRIIALVRRLAAQSPHRGRRIRSEPGAGSMDGSDIGVDAIVRGEGDVTFRELIRAFEDRQPLVERSPGSGSAMGDRSPATRIAP